MNFVAVVFALAGICAQTESTETSVNGNLGEIVAGAREIASEKLCGPNSLLIALRLIGRETSVDELNAVLEHPDGPTTMLELKNAASALGVPCLAVKWSSGARPEVPCPAIVALRMDGLPADHFVVLAGKVGQRYQVLDFGRRHGFMPASNLKRNWNGYALYLASDEGELDHVKGLFPPSWTWRTWGTVVIASLFGVGLVVLVRIRSSKQLGVSSITSS